MRSNYAEQKHDAGDPGGCGEMPIIPKEIIDQFVSGPMTETVNDLPMAFRKALIERAFNAERPTTWAIPRG